LGPCRLQLGLELLGRQQLPAVDHPKELAQRLAQPGPIHSIPFVRQRRDELHVADQVGQAELERHVELAQVTPIGREIVAAQHPVKLRAQNLDQHIGAARRVDLEQRVQAGPKAPGPLPYTILLVTSLVDVEPLLVRQALQQFLIGLLQRLTHLGNDIRQLPTRDGHPENIANVFADGGERSVADSLEEGDHGGQPGPHQAAAFDTDGQWGLVAVHRCSSSCFAEAFAREYGHQWTTIGVSGYGSWLVSTSRSLIRCSRRGCRRHRRTHFRTSRSLQTLHPSTPPALRSLRLPATVMAARCQRTTPQLPPPSTQTPIALAVCKSRSLSRSVRTSGFPFHSLYPA